MDNDVKGEEAKIQEKLIVASQELKSIEEN